VCKKRLQGSGIVGGGKTEERGGGGVIARTNQWLDQIATVTPTRRSR